MKTILSLAGGALTVTEDQGKISLSFDEALGGGKAAGILSGKGSIVLDADKGLQLGESLVNAHLPVSIQPMAVVIETVVNQALRALE